MKSYQERKFLIMNNKSAVLTISKPAAIVVFIVLLGIGTIAPLIGNQFITGSIVNATLLISVAVLGIQNALLIGMIPSIIALATGLLPAVMAPMVPFIILGNAVLVMMFGYLMNKNYWVGAVSGAVVKFGFLWGTSFIVINMVVNQQISDKIAMMMSWPQLVTALIGSLLAYGTLYLLRQVHK
jgi:hypothetical protein